MGNKPNIYGGGARTNENGLYFEQTTDLNSALEKAGYSIEEGFKVFRDGEFIGFSVPKHDFYRNFLQLNGIDFTKINSKKWLPDEAFVNEKTRTVYIIEKKFQKVSGSVDEKLPNCDFKKKEYIKLLSPIGYSVEYIYVFNEWFEKDIYKDTLEYIESVGCKYWFNEIPLDFLGL